MKLISWNINGIRACESKGGFDFLATSSAGASVDFLGVQEIKATEDKFPQSIGTLGFLQRKVLPAARAGYSGVASFFNMDASTQSAQFWDDDEGRVLEHRWVSRVGEVVLFNIYFPNGQRDDERLDYKMRFYAEFLKYLKSLLASGLRVIICGDVNTAHREIDLANPKANSKTSGFLPCERAWIDELLDSGFIDTFRAVHGDMPGKYSWWSYRSAARTRNVGWRIDYFFISNNLAPFLRDAFILADVKGSDHCPVGIELDI